MIAGSIIDELIDITKWKNRPKYKGIKRGTCDKQVVADPEDGMLCIFKLPKEDRKHQIWSEMLASFIAGQLGWDAQRAGIVDMKWKRLKKRDSGTVFGATQGDIYQMMTYQRVYECPKVMLLFPHNDDLSSDHVRRAYSVASPESEDRLVVATLDVTEPRKTQKKKLRGLIESEAG